MSGRFNDIYRGLVRGCWRHLAMWIFRPGWSEGRHLGGSPVRHCNRKERRPAWWWAASDAGPQCQWIWQLT